MNSPIELPVSELKLALTGFSKVISKSSLPVLRSIRVTKDADGRVSLAATDLDSFVSYRAEEEQPEKVPVTFLVPFESLAKTVKKALAKDRIGLFTEEKDRVVIRSMVSHTPIEEVFRVDPVEDWPVVPHVSGAIMPMQEVFKIAFKQAMDCASTEETRYVLNGVCLDTVEPQNHYVVGTNGRHLYAANSFCFDCKERIIVPNRRFLNWSGFLDDGLWSLAVQPGKEPEPSKDKDQKEEKEPGFIQIVSNHWTFITKLVDGVYPNWKQVLPDPNRPKTGFHLPEESVTAMLEILPRIPGADGLNDPVTLEMQSNQLLLRGRNSAKDRWTIIPVPGAIVPDQQIEVCLNRNYLAKALRMGLAEIELSPNGESVICRNGGRVIVIGPLRSELPKPEPAKPQTEPAASTQP